MPANHIKLQTALPYRRLVTTFLGSKISSVDLDKNPKGPEILDKSRSTNILSNPQHCKNLILRKIIPDFKVISDLILSLQEDFLCKGTVKKCEISSYVDIEKVYRPVDGGYSFVWAFQKCSSTP